MNEDDLRTALRATARAVDPAPRAWGENQRRLQSSRRARRAALAAGALTAAAGVALATALAGGLLTGSAPEPDRLDSVDAPAPDDRPLSVGLSVFGAGPLQITVGAPSAGANSWQEHAFVVRNTSAETVHVNDPRFSRFLGGRRLLLGLGCGHGVVDGQAQEACFADYAPQSLAPGESFDLPMLLFRDLPGMQPLHSARYPANADLTYRTGAPFTSAEDGAGASIAQVSLAYTVREPVTGTDVGAAAPFTESGVVPPGCVPGGVPQDNVRCELAGGFRVDVVEAEVLGPAADVLRARPGSDTALSYGPHVAVTIDSREERFVPGLAFGAASARSADGDGALGISGLCGRGWTRGGVPVTEDPCPALTPVTFVGPGNDSFAFTLHPRIGDRSIAPGRYELVLPLDREPTGDALRLVLVVSSVAPVS